MHQMEEPERISGGGGHRAATERPLKLFHEDPGDVIDIGKVYLLESSFRRRSPLSVLSPLPLPLTVTIAQIYTLTL